MDLTAQMAAVEVLTSPDLAPAAYQHGPVLPFEQWQKQGCMVTEDGKPSLATDEDEYRLVRTPSFAEWSAEGCLRHQLTGEPQKVWRGEGGGDLFEVFDARKTREGYFFFATAKGHADAYAEQGGEATRSFFIQGSNILDLTSIDYTDEKTMGFIRDYSEEFDEWVDRTSGEDIDALTMIECGDIYNYEGTGSGQRWQRMFQMARNHGYDAVIAPDITDYADAQSPTVVAFRPEQVLFAESREMAIGTGEKLAPAQEMSLPSDPGLDCAPGAPALSGYGF